MENAISILIVEDEEIWIESLHRTLAEFGFSIAKTVTNVNDALTAFGNCEYDLILMDIHLDGRNSGIELGKVVNKLYNKPFIFITASHDHHIKEAAIVNPSAYLIKPINPSSLFIAIQNALYNFQNKHTAVVKTGEDDFTSFFVKQGNRYKKIDWKDKLG